LSTIVAAAVFPLKTFAASKFNIIPKISAAWEMDSNFYLAQENEREVYTYIIRPGFRAEFETAKSALMLDYTLDAYYYDDRDPVPPGERPSDEEDYTGHTFTGEAKYQAFTRMLLGLNASSYITRDPGQSDDFSNSISRDKYTVNRITPFIVYDFGRKFSARLGYAHEDLDYSPEDREDSEENRGTFDLVYNFTPKNSLDLEFQHWKKEYDGPTSDYTSNQAKLIFRRQFKNFKISAGAGYQNRNFDDSSLDDLDEFTYNLNLEGGGLIANRRSYISFNVEQNLNDQIASGDNYYLATRFILSGGHEFSRKLLGHTEASYMIADYQLDDRKDNIYGFLGRISYKLARWMIFSVEGGIENRDSNFEGRDYDNTYFSLTLDFAYDFAKN
jgi:hypothetical protein